MILTVDQVQSILDVIDNNNIMLINKQLGPNYLTKQELDRLNKIGIDVHSFYDESQDIVKLSLHFGLISDAIGELQSKKATHKDLIDYFKSGKYIPLSQTDKYVLDSVKKQYLGDIRANKGRIFSDVNNIISKDQKNNRLEYEKVIRGEIERGLSEKKTKQQIARDLGKLTGDWNRNFKRIVDYVSHTAYDEGRALAIQKRNGDSDPLVWKKVFGSACKHCIRLYHTKGLGSKPKVFKLSELIANGTNIGRKVDEWKPVVGSTHPHCRCTLFEYTGMFEWDEDKKDFAKPNPNYKDQKPINRRKVKFSFMGKDYEA